MESLLKSDIFFFITSVVVILIGIGVIAVIIYLIRILSDVKDVSKTVRKEADEMVKDISNLRTNIKTNKTTWGLLSFLGALFVKKKKGRKH